MFKYIFPIVLAVLVIIFFLLATTDKIKVTSTQPTARKGYLAAGIISAVLLWVSIAYIGTYQ